MKGVIPMCLSKLVIEKFGKDQWTAILQAAGFEGGVTFLAGQDVDDNVILKILDKTTEILKITVQQAAEAFGDYWVSHFALKIYKNYYKNISCAKDFLLNLDSVHKETTETIANAHPPRFEYEQPDNKTLIMKYKSERGLIDIFMGLIKGVGKHFNENLHIEKLEASRVKISFLG